MARAFLERAAARLQQLPNLVTHRSKARQRELAMGDLLEVQQILLLLPESPDVEGLRAGLREAGGAE